MTDIVSELKNNFDVTMIRKCAVSQPAVGWLWILAHQRR